MNMNKFIYLMDDYWFELLTDISTTFVVVNVLYQIMIWGSDPKRDFSMRYALRRIKETMNSEKSLMANYLMISFISLIFTIGAKTTCFVNYNIFKIMNSILWNQITVCLIWSIYELCMNAEQRFRWYNFGKLAEYANKYDNFHKKMRMVDELKNDPERMHIYEFDMS